MACPSLKLNSGYSIPVIGLGTYKSTPDDCIVQAVKDAIEVGYRHLDSAYMYVGEPEVGEGIMEKINDGTVKREDLFITGKLWNTFHSKDLVLPGIKKSLKNLRVDYLDLFLIHWPVGYKEGGDLVPKVNNVIQFSDVDYIETWKAMEELVDLGLTKSIGVSNFNSEQIDRILSICRIPPAVNQVECNPNLNQKKLIEFCRQRNILVVGFSPLGRPAITTGAAGRPQPNIKDEKIIEMAKKYGKSTAQVILRYLVSLGISVIPKSVTKSRMMENINIFDFELNDEEIRYMDSLNKNIRVCASTELQDHKHYPFNIEF